MPNVRKIRRTLPDKKKNFYVVDACFLVNKYLPIDRIRDLKEKDRIISCQNWWNEIDKQLKRGKARVYIPAACIAESFKVLAKKAFHPNHIIFKNTQQYNYWKSKLSKDISLPTKKLRSFSRSIHFHDIPFNRDIIISVDRFNELFSKHKRNVGIVDLSVAATAKYLMDFYDIPKDNLHIVTLDKALRLGIDKSQDLPIAYDPTIERYSVSSIFE